MAQANECSTEEEGKFQCYVNNTFDIRLGFVLLSCHVTQHKVLINLSIFLMQTKGSQATGSKRRSVSYSAKLRN